MNDSKDNSTEQTTEATTVHNTTDQSSDNTAHTGKHISWIGTLILLLLVGGSAYIAGHGNISEITDIFKRDTTPSVIITDRVMPPSAPNKALPEQTETEDMKALLRSHHTYITKKLPETLAIVDTRLAMLEKKLESLSEANDNNTLSAISQEQITSISEQIVTLRSGFEDITERYKKQHDSAETYHVLQQMVAYHHLYQAITAHTPFILPLQEFKALLAPQSRLYKLVSQLDVFAHKGILPFERRKALFYDAWEKAHQAKIDSNLSMTDSISQRLSGLIAIRKVGADHEGGDKEAVLARLRAAYEAHSSKADISRLIDQLPEQTQPYFSSWRSSELNARDVTTLTETIYTALITQLQPQESPSVSEKNASSPSEDAPATSQTEPKPSN